MGSESVFSHQEARDRIGGAVIGLLLAVMSFVILQTINPSLTYVGLNVPEIVIEGARPGQGGDYLFCYVGPLGGMHCYTNATACQDALGEENTIGSSLCHRFIVPPPSCGSEHTWYYAFIDNLSGGSNGTAEHKYFRTEPECRNDENSVITLDYIAEHCTRCPVPVGETWCFPGNGGVPVCAESEDACNTQRESYPPPPPGPCARQGGGGGGTASHNAALARMNAAGITVYSSGGCADRNRSDCTSLDGIRDATISEVIRFKQACSSCSVIVTGGTETGHVQDSCSHGNGNKIDIDDTPSVVDFIERTCPRDGSRGEPHGGPRYRCNGVEYVREISFGHFDIAVGC